MGLCDVCDDWRTQSLDLHVVLAIPTCDSDGCGDCGDCGDCGCDMCWVLRVDENSDASCDNHHNVYWTGETSDDKTKTPLPCHSPQQRQQSVIAKGKTHRQLKQANPHVSQSLNLDDEHSSGPLMKNTGCGWRSHTLATRTDRGRTG